jgi:hypothetical protein
VKNEMGFECRASGKKIFVNMAFIGKPEKSNQSEDLDIGGKKMLKCDRRM